MFESPDKKTCTCWYCDGELQLVEDLRNSDRCDDDPLMILQCMDCGADLWIYENADYDEDGNPIELEYSEDAEDAPYDRNRCPNCGGYAIWGSDFNYDEVFGEGSGIASYLHCQRCFSSLEYSVRDDEPQIIEGDEDSAEAEI